MHITFRKCYSKSKHSLDLVLRISKGHKSFIILYFVEGKKEPSAEIFITNWIVRLFFRNQKEVKSMVEKEDWEWEEEEEEW